MLTRAFGFGVIEGCIIVNRRIGLRPIADFPFDVRNIDIGQRAHRPGL